MKAKRLAVLGSAWLAITTWGAAQDAPRANLAIAEKGSGYQVTVPVSQLTLAIPKGRLAPSAAPAGSASPRYFYFADHAGTLIASGWFEPAGAFKGVQEFWAGEQASLKKQGLEPQDVAITQIGKWNVIAYDLRVADARSANLRAEWVEAGTWIDIHLSLTGTLASDALRADLRAVLATLAVTVKAP